MYRRLSLTVAAAWLAAFAAPAGADSRPTLLTLSNSATGNSVLAFRQKPDGSLKPAGEFPTGGLGTGGGLGNQGSLAAAGDFVLAVNAGSDQLSVLRRARGGLDLVDVEPSGGSQPVSVTAHGRLVYVLNAGSDSIAGFRINEWGKLNPLAGSVLGLSGGSVGAAQIEFAAHGRVLIVTEKATNLVVTFTLNGYGLPTGPQTFASPGATPFGFDVSKNRRVFVWKLRAEQLGIELRASAAPDAPLAVGDVALVERVLENLVDNALKHTNSGGRISLELRTGQRHVRVAVVDNGCGVAAADLPHVFDRYYRGGERLTAERAGLGLAIVRRIVELHGESVRLTSSAGLGTCVEFGLPVPFKDDPPVGSVGRGAAGAAALRSRDT